MNVFTNIKKIINELFSLDNPFDESNPIQKGVIDSNGAAYKSFLFGVLGTCIVAYFLPNPYIWVSFMVTGGYLLTILFNYLHWYKLAKANVWTFSAIAFFLLASIYGYDSGFHYLYIVITLAIMFKHQKGDLIPSFLPVIIMIICIVILYATNFSLLHVQDFPPQALKIINHYCFFSCLGSCIFIGLYVIREAERKNQKIIALKEIEQKVLRSQMNPHFIFNVLNSIQAYILEHNSEDAVRFLGKFSQLIRKVLQHSQYPTIPLEDELNALELYLQLENFRLSQGLKYRIVIGDTINPKKMLIPPIILQPIVENSIWHGIAPCKKEGEIHISIQRKGNQIICVVEDNGIGLMPKSHITKHESIGLANIQERLSHFANEHGQNIEMELSNKQEGNGARLRLIFPYVSIL